MSIQLLPAPLTIAQKIHLVGGETINGGPVRITPAGHKIPWGEFPIPQYLNAYNPTVQTDRAPAKAPHYKFNNTRGNVPVDPRPDSKSISVTKWEKAFNAAHSRIGRGYEALGCDKEDCKGIRGEDQLNGQTRAEAVRKLIEDGELEDDFWDDPSRH